VLIDRTEVAVLWTSGVALSTVMLGMAGGSGFRGRAIADPRREFGPDGGGDLMRGDMGNSGVVSPDTVVLFCPRLGSFEGASAKILC
jgi:hypothetical protein